MQISSSHPHSASISSSVKPSLLLDQRITDVATLIFTKFASTLFVFGCVATFSAATVTSGLCATVLVISVAPLALHLLATWTRREEKALNPLNKIVTLSSANAFATGYTGILLHETGHFLAANACFKNPDARIHIYPFLGGATTFNTASPMRQLRVFLGERRALLAITAGGIVMTAISATIAIVASHYLSSEHPITSDFLLAHGICQVANDIGYGLTTFTANPAEMGHDFMRLWVLGGVHPLIPISLLFLIPAAALLATRALTKN